MTDECEDAIARLRPVHEELLEAQKKLSIAKDDLDYIVRKVNTGTKTGREKYDAKKRKVDKLQAKANALSERREKLRLDANRLGCFEGK